MLSWPTLIVIAGFALGAFDVVTFPLWMSYVGAVIVFAFMGAHQIESLNEERRELASLRSDKKSLEDQLAKVQVCPHCGKSVHDS